MQWSLAILISTVNINPWVPYHVLNDCQVILPEEGYNIMITLLHLLLLQAGCDVASSPVSEKLRLRMADKARFHAHIIDDYGILQS